MVKNNGRFNSKFDIQYLKKIVENYSEAVGVDSTIIDLEGNSLFQTNLTYNCSICNYVKSTMSDDSFCKKSRLYGAYQAERFHGKYVFFCPIGLVNWASPITINGIMEGAIITGPILMTNPDELLIEEITKKSNYDKLDMDYIIKNLNTIDVVPSKKVHSMSEMLFILTSHISDINHYKYIDEQTKQKQQSDISEYIQYIKTLDEEEQNKIGYPIEKEKELVSCIKSKDISGGKKILNEILGSIFFLTGGSISKTKARILELVVLLSRAALENGGNSEEIFGLNYKYIEELKSINKIEDINYWLSKIVIRFSNLVFNMNEIRHVDVIYKSLDYIKCNYTNKITLEEVANHVHLSPTYFSKIFKDEMKCTFKKHLQKHRVEKSKSMLLKKEIPLVDIPNLVGFEDQSYYSKVFKKITGISPGRYREKNCMSI